MKKVENDADSYVIMMMAVFVVGGFIAERINLPGIVGAFLAGVSVNAAVQHKPAKEKLEFFGNSFFIPIFFAVTGFLIDPIKFFGTVAYNFPLVLAIILALLVGKGIAAGIVGKAFAYNSPAHKTMWSLTLPQVAATIAATLAGCDILNRAGQRLLDANMLNAVLVLLSTTSILGPMLTERFATEMSPETTPPSPRSPAHVT